MAKKKKYKSAKMSSEALKAIWDASKNNVYRNKKKYCRKQQKRAWSSNRSGSFVV